ncbi:MAG: hypothetical protein HQ483_10595 [Rhodospirillales bacterium]|nr:hypothetical protein [Rhodospirillales bacterium]
MTTAKSQKKWRDKHRLVKTQLNVMARKAVHGELDRLAESFALRGKGEAVSFAVFMTQALHQRAEFNSEAARMLDDFAAAFHRDRDLYSN